MTSESLRILRERVSIRKFKPDPVPVEVLRELCMWGARAPSACNMQDWRFIIVNQEDLKRRIVDSGASILIAQAPAGILVSYARDTKNIVYQDGVQSAAAAIENILLAASSYGLGACWIGNLPRKNRLRKLMKMPTLHEPIGYIILGYPEAVPGRTQPLRYAPEELVGMNSFPSPLRPMRKFSVAKTGILRFLVSFYGHSPVWLKKIFLNKLIDARFTKKF